MSDQREGVLASVRATPRAIRFLLAGVLINQLGAYVQTFLLLYLTFRGVSVARSATCLVAYSIGSILGTFLGGELTDRFGPRRTITLAMASSAPLVASIPVLSRTGLFGPLVGVVLLAGLVTQAYRPAAFVLINDLMPAQHKLMAFSMMRTAMNIGAALAPLIAAGLILLDWDLLYWIDGATALAYAVLAFTFLPRQVTRPAGSPVEAQDEAVVHWWSGYAVMLQDRKFLAYLLSVVVGTFAFAQSTIALPLQIIKDGHPAGLYSAVLTVSSVLIVAVELKLTTYTSRWEPHVSAFVGHLVLAVGLAAYGLSTQNGGFVIAAAVVETTGLMIAGPSMTAHPTLAAPAELKARYAGAGQALMGLGLAIAPALGLFAWIQLGVFFWVMLGLLTAAAGVFALIGIRQPAARPGFPQGRSFRTSTDSEPETVGGKA
jgi:MFS family permease